MVLVQNLRGEPVPAEIRHILFRHFEIVSAVRDHRTRLRQPLPRGSISRCGIVKNAPDVRFYMDIADSGTPERVVIGTSALAAALLLYCRDHKIPLPSDAQKELRQIGDTVVLVLTRNPTDLALPRLELVLARGAATAVLAGSGLTLQGADA